MAELIAGVEHLRDGIEAQIVIGADMSVVGIAGTAPGADPLIFPLNKAVVVRTNDKAKRTSLGLTGTIVDALAGLSSQIGGNVGAAQVVVVRVEAGADAHATIANLIGAENLGTGVWAFLDAPQEHGLTPRLLIVPGFTSQSKTGIADPVITAPGADGTDGTFALAFTGGTGSGAAGTFTVVDGSVTTIAITARGEYTVAPSLDFSASANLAGATATVALEQLTNGVCAVMPAICDRLRAHFLPEGPTASRTAWLDWLETLPQTSRFLHPLRQDAKVLDSEGDVVTKPLSPFIIGRYVRRDAEKGGVPSHSVANQSLNGLVGVTPLISFSITDASSEGQADLAAGAGIVFRGDFGVGGSLTDGGWTFWGTDTLSPDSSFLFANVCRMRDYIELTQVRIVRPFLGVENLTRQTIESILTSLKAEGSRLKADGHVIDFRVGFEPDQNTPEELMLGNIDTVFKAHEPSPLRKVRIRSRRFPEAYAALVQSISTQLEIILAS